MPELDFIIVRGFKSISSVEELRLGTINILVSPNGSGKSNFTGVFSFLNAIRSGHLQQYVLTAGGAERVFHFGSKVITALELYVLFQNGTNRDGSFLARSTFTIFGGHTHK